MRKHHLCREEVLLDNMFVIVRMRAMYANGMMPIVSIGDD